MHDSQRIAFIGGGNMGSAIIGGLIANGFAAERVHVADRDRSRLQLLADTYGVATGTDNAACVRSADVVVLAVKPDVLAQVCRELAPAIGRSALVVSIAAGARSSALARWLGAATAVVRAMPNTPALVRQGVTGLFANARVSAQQRQVADRLLAAVGVTLWLDDEAHLDAVTAVSGSGPAYFFRIMEAMEAGAIQLGLNAHQARTLVLETALGAARLAHAGAQDPATLRRNVTSRGGTTERGLAVLEQGDIEALLARALQAAKQRSEELAASLGDP